MAKIVYRRGTANLKRVLALGGAKNHLIVMPDADREMTSTQRRRVDVRLRRPALHGGVGDDGRSARPITSSSGWSSIARSDGPGQATSARSSRAEAKERIERYITEAEEAGAKVLVDGRGYVVPGKENGYYVGPTLIDHVTPDMRIAQEEVFGPVMVIIRAKDVDEALAVENASPYGNAASVFTESGGVARYVMENASAGMVGVNVGVPVPREPFWFGGWNESKFGVGDITGRGSIEFWTQVEEDDDEVESRKRA